MEADNGQKKKDTFTWRPVILFYARTTGWIVIPLIVALVLGRAVAPALELVFVLAGFAITCYGIYREVREYKQSLAKEDAPPNNNG